MLAWHFEMLRTKAYGAPYMVTPRVEIGFEQDRFRFPRDPSLTPDLSRVLVAGLSQINRIVVSRIVERCGLRPVSETPGAAVRVLPVLFPGLVVLDGGADNHDCDSVLSGIAALRRLAGRGLPATILLSNRNNTPETVSATGLFDAVVAKPFTTDQLQPVIERLLDHHR